MFLKQFLITATASLMLVPPATAQTVAPTETASIVGKWTWKLDVGPSSGQASMVVEEVDGKLVAKVTAPDGESFQSGDFKFEKERVQFSIKRSIGPFQIVMSHSGKLKDGSITGTFKMEGGPMRKSGKWQATREKQVK